MQCYTLPLMSAFTVPTLDEPAPGRHSSHSTAACRPVCLGVVREQLVAAIGHLWLCSRAARRTIQSLVRPRSTTRGRLMTQPEASQSQDAVQPAARNQSEPQPSQALHALRLNIAKIVGRYFLPLLIVTMLFALFL